MNDPVNLRSGKQALIDTLRNSGLDGLSPGCWPGWP